MASEKQLNESQMRFVELERRVNEMSQLVEKQTCEINEKNASLSSKEVKVNEQSQEIEKLTKSLKDLEELNHEFRTKCESLENRLNEIQRNNNHENHENTVKYNNKT